MKLELSVDKEGLEPIMGAAYLMMDRSWVMLDGNRTKAVTVTLKPKGAPSPESLSELKRTFLRELEAQKVRWAIAKNNLPIREFIAEQAVLLANGKLPPPETAPAGGAVDDQLSEEQRQEIEKLIAEVECEIKAMNEKKAAPDPKNIRATWEEKQEAKKA